MKNHKIRLFYPVVSGSKPNATTTRHFIHSKASEGLWAEIRDLSQKEILANEAVGKQSSIYITVGFNPAVLERWEELIIIDEQQRTYRMKTKPDEFDYSKRDIRIAAYEFKDTTVYTEGDVYD